MAWADAFRTPGLRLDATIRSALGDVESRVCRAPFAHCEDGYLAVPSDSEMPELRRASLERRSAAERLTACGRCG